MSSTLAPAGPAPASVRPPRPRPRWGSWALVALAVAVTAVAAAAIDFDLAPLLTDTGRGWFIVSQFLAPDWGFLAQTGGAWLDTISIAIVASLAGCVLALVISLLASDVTAGRGVYRVAKFLLAVLRSLPDVVWGMLAVAVVGIGSMAGTLALVMFSLGIVAKLTAETVDAVDRGPLESADSSGANVVQRAWVAVVPQVLPNYFSYAMYAFELNVRASVVIGFVGAGGIGNTISVELARFNYDNLAAVIIALFVAVFLLDLASRAIRRRLIG